MKVWFEDRFGEERQIGDCINEREARQIIYQFLNAHNFKAPYTRSWEVDGRTKVDVGSHTEFFYIEN